MRMDPLSAFVGLSFFGVGIYLLWQSITLSRRGSRAQGTIVEMVYDSGPGLRFTRYAPRIEYTTAHGAKRVFIDPTRHWQGSYQAGDHVVVLYDPEDPSRARLSSVFSLYILPGLFSLVGLFVLFIGWLFGPVLSLTV